MGHFIAGIAIAAAVSAVGAVPAAAQCAASRARLEFPALDVPYNVEHGVRAPGMPQALAVSSSFYEASHRAIQSAWGSRQTLGRTSVFLWDLANYLVLPLPGGDAWLHEEFHRAVMGRRGIDSFNDVYKLRIGAGAIAVSRVRDGDLVRLKAEHPAEQVRLSAAGMEGEHLLVRTLQRYEFFDCSPAWHSGLYLFSKLGSILYVRSGSSADVNAETDEMNSEDGPDVAVRDFTGHDFTAWVYDLHRSREPYSARGIHPSGVGIDRYRKPAHLTPDELAYLRRQGRYQLLNLIDPFLLDIRGFTVTNPFNGAPMRFNASVGHVLAPFGHTVHLNFFFMQEYAKVFAVLHTYANGDRRFPGLDLMVVDYPVDVGRRTFEVTLRGSVWLQPEDLRFRTTESRAGALAALKVHGATPGRLGAFLEIESKTSGWVPGNVYLGPNVSARVGMSVALR